MIHQTCIFKTVFLVKAVNSENICLPAFGITREYMCPANGRGDRISGNAGMNNPMALGYIKIVKYQGLTFAVGCLPICCVLIDIMLRVGLLYI